MGESELVCRVLSEWRYRQPGSTWKADRTNFWPELQSKRWHMITQHVNSRNQRRILTIRFMSVG